MWPRTFEERLTAWNQLRQSTQNLPLQACLLEINQWWFRTPWSAYHLHWDDRPTWPDPWQLLSDNIFCPLARGLGMLYTIALLERGDLANAVLIDTGTDNLVLVEGEKYILNWDADEIVNINLGPYKVRHSIAQSEIQQQIR